MQGNHLSASVLSVLCGELLYRIIWRILAAVASVSVPSMLAPGFDSLSPASASSSAVGRHAGGRSTVSASTAMPTRRTDLHLARIVNRIGGLLEESLLLPVMHDGSGGGDGDGGSDDEGGHGSRTPAPSSRFLSADDGQVWQTVLSYLKLVKVCTAFCGGGTCTCVVYAVVIEQCASLC